MIQGLLLIYCLFIFDLYFFSVGKTSLINRYVNEEFRYYCPVTLIFDGFCKLIDFDDKTIINLQVSLIR